VSGRKDRGSWEGEKVMVLKTNYQYRKMVFEKIFGKVNSKIHIKGKT